jgi:hypothetical protein
VRGLNPQLRAVAAVGVVGPVPAVEFILGGGHDVQEERPRGIRRPPKGMPITPGLGLGADRPVSGLRPPDQWNQLQHGIVGLQGQQRA